MSALHACPGVDGVACRENARVLSGACSACKSRRRKKRDQRFATANERPRARKGPKNGR